MRLAGALLAALAASGCASIADRVVEPHGRAQIGPRQQQDIERYTGTIRDSATTPAGVKLAYRLVPPAHRGMHYEVMRRPGRTRFDLSFDHAPTALPVSGTIVYLHGWGTDSASMLPWAWAMSEHGYRGIAMDLRNFGASSRAPVGFGPREAADVVALLDILQRRGELQEPLYLFGVSYGATTALFAEPALRARIKGIVAMEPFANAADGIRGVVAGMLKDTDPPRGLRGHLLHAYTRRAYSPDAIDRSIVEAGERLHLDLAHVDVRTVLAQSQTCTLLIHGEADTWLTAEATHAMASLSPGLRYAGVPAANHLNLPVRVDWLVQPLAEWMQAQSKGRCEPLALPPDPAADPA